MKIHVMTNGCEVGRLKSKSIEGFFVENGLSVTNDSRDADILVFYACGLTQKKEKDSLDIIRKLQNKIKLDTQLLVWGCLTRINPVSLNSVYKGPLIGPGDVKCFEKLLDTVKTPYSQIRMNTAIVPFETVDLPKEAKQNDFGISFLSLAQQGAIRFLGQKSITKEMRNCFYIRVAEGCSGHCTYCSERLVWGKVRSRPVKDIVNELEIGLQKGYDLFFLCAEDLGAYGTDIGCTVCDLLRKLVQVDHKRFKIIINEMSPTYLKKMFPEFREIFASGMIDTVGCQVESGSDRILKLMGRDHTVADWREYMVRINNEFPQIRLMTHFMIGFPTETEEDFKKTLKLLEYPLFIQEIGIFKFSSRPMIPASRLPKQVSESTKESRAKRLYRKYLYMYSLNTSVRTLRRLFSVAS